MEILNIDPKVLIVQIGGFVLLLIVFKLFLFKPVLGMLDARRSEIEGRYSDAEAVQKTAEEIRSEYERHLAGVHDEIRSKITEAVKEGQAMREEIIADSRTKADDILTKAQEEIGRERDRAIAELKTTVVNLTVDAAGKLIEEKLDVDKHHELIGKFIDGLDGVAK